MAAPERVTPVVYRVDAVGFSNAVSVLLLEDADGWTLVDTDVGSSVGRIRKALATLGGGPEDLRRIYLTHHHSDHVGGLPDLHWWAPGVEVMSSEHEAEIISSKRRPDPSSKAIFRFVNRFQQLSTAPVGRVVCEGDVVAAGFRIVSMSGHALGHTSLLRDEDSLLFTADAFGALPCRIQAGVQKAFCTDPSQTRNSAERLLEEEFDHCYHESW